MRAPFVSNAAVRGLGVRPCLGRSESSEEKGSLRMFGPPPLAGEVGIRRETVQWLELS